MENNINIYVYISIYILIIIYIYINCNTKYSNDKNIISYNVIIIFLIFLLIFFSTNIKNKKKHLRKYNEKFDISTNIAQPTLVKYGYLNKPISYKDVIYGKPIFYWEGINIILNNNIINTFTLMGKAFLNQDNIEVEYNKRYVLRFLNTSKTNLLPTDYVVFKLPIDPLTHNTVFIQVRARDKWSNINMCICNKNTNEPVKKVVTLCNTINHSDWYNNSSIIGPYNNVALNAVGYYEWLSFPISYNDIQKYKDTENNIYISLNQGLTNNINYTNPNMEISGIATTSNPYGVYIVPVSNYQLKNFEIYKIYNNNIIPYGAKTEHWNDDQQMIINTDNIIKMNIPVIDNTCGIIIGLITHNNTWYDSNPTIFINNNFYKKYKLNNLLVGRVGMSIIGRGIYRHPRGIYLSKTFVKNNVLMSNDGTNYISLIIDNNYETSNLYLRAVYSELVESNLEQYIINPAPTKTLYDLNSQPISYMENIYDEPMYYWEGFTNITNDLDITTRFTNYNSTINETYYLNDWDKRTTFHFTNTSDTNDIPVNYILLKVPIKTNTHNTIFLKVRARDRWTNINMYLCNKTSKVPKKKIISSSSINGSNNTSNLGPFNNTALEGYYEWISFPIPQIYNTSEFVDNNEIYVSINKAINGDSNIFIAGVAVCANPYAVTNLQAINLHWNNNGLFIKNGNTWNSSGLTWNTHNWNDESLAYISAGQIFKIRIPILNNNKGIIIGIITHNNTWYDCNPRIYFESNPEVFYMLSPLIIGKYGFANMNRGIYRASRGIYIPSDVIIANIKKSYDFMYLEIIIDNSIEINALNIRSIYTEAIEPL